MAPARINEVPATGMEARQQARTNAWNAPTSGLAPGYLQANLLILPSRYAKDFALLCARNPVPCPLLASSALPGDFNHFVSHLPDVSDSKIAGGIDIRTDAPRYNVYVDGKLSEEAIPDVISHWDGNDHVAFLIGCSFSFENALTDAGLSPPHSLHGRSPPMYRTNVQLCPAGVFKHSNYVVSMRMYRSSEVERVRDITRAWVRTHGEPIAWDWDGMRRLGIKDIKKVDWGEVPVNCDGDEIVPDEEEGRVDGLVPVFWGCGVTPQEAVMRAQIPGMVIGHTPSHMILLDVKDDDVLSKSA